MEIVTTNANTLFSDGFWKLKTSGVKSDSRNGPVIRIEEPVMITVNTPAERVLFHEGRDAPHIFHLLESVWLLAGRNDVGFLQQFNSRIGQYSDNGETFNASYGFRMRHHFGQDQLLAVIEILRKDPNSRQAVIQLWDADDLTKTTLDKCCNTQLTFAIVNGKMNLTVSCRSNDFLWGNSGANIVHFSFMLEFVSAAVGVPVGKMYTLINNLHLYTTLYSATQYLDNPPNPEEYDLYTLGQVTAEPIMQDNRYLQFLDDCEVFCDRPFDPDVVYHHPFFHNVAQPMAMVSKVRKDKLGTGEEWAAKITAPDWRRAVQDWIHRRESKKAKAIAV